MAIKKTGSSKIMGTSSKKIQAPHVIQFGFATGAFESQQVDALIIGVFSDKKTASVKASKADSAVSLQWTSELKALDKALQGMILSVALEEKFDGGAAKSLVFRKSPSYKISARRIVLVGLGQPEKLTAAVIDKSVQRGINAITSIDAMAHLAIALPFGAAGTEKLSADILLQSAVDAAYQTIYYSQEALEETRKKKQTLKKITLLTNQPATTAEKSSLAVAEVMARARSKTKDLVNMPSNIKRTDTLVEFARETGKKPLITLSVQSDVKWIQKNMPCFFAVAQGSLDSDPPQFIHLQYKPKSGKAKKKIALIGKSVIFDTGGYQVKTGNHMNTMKADMTGGAVMSSVMAALADLKLEHLEVHAFMAATPNKIDTHAFLPDSIYPSACGKFVEIRHTDAEGRLTLIDAVAKAAEQKPDEMVCMATLTGSAAQAVGMAIALMGNDDDLINRVHQAAELHCEPIQTLKVIEDDYTNIKSKLDGADLINTNSGKGRGAQTAAAFVMSGAPEGVPFAHMDIAGADMTGDEKATGIGVKTVIQYLLSENERAAGQHSAKSPAKRSSKPL